MYRSLRDEQAGATMAHRGTSCAFRGPRFPGSGFGGCASLSIRTFRFSRVRFRASFSNRVFCFFVALLYSSRTRAKYCSRECMSILQAYQPFFALHISSPSVRFLFDPTVCSLVRFYVTQFAQSSRRPCFDILIGQYDSYNFVPNFLALSSIGAYCPDRI